MHGGSVPEALTCTSERWAVMHKVRQGKGERRVEGGHLLLAFHEVQGAVVAENLERDHAE